MTMRDKLVLSGMRFFGYHGVLPEERVQGQEFVVDVELEGEYRAAGTRDDLNLTVDYRRAYDLVRQVMEGQSTQLLEALAETIARRLLTHLGRVTAVTVRVRKPGVKLPGPLDFSGVEIHRRRK